VFFQKFAGAYIVLDERERLMLMEEEIQARIPAYRFTLVHHEEGDVHDHLEGEPCLICLQKADEGAKARLEQEREALRQERAASSSAS
jgi:hypothetical protein